VIVTPVSSNTVVEKCETFREVIRTKIGSPYVIAAMQAALQAHPPGTVVAGYEANGGFLLGSDVQMPENCLKALPTRDAVLPILSLLTTAAKRGVALSELPKELPRRFTASDRIQNVATESSHSLITSMRNGTFDPVQILAPGAGPVIEQDVTDGLRLTFKSGEIVHLRPSGNAPELRCYSEANSQERAMQLSSEALQRISAVIL
jgi:phosphomannomutase